MKRVGVQSNRGRSTLAAAAMTIAALKVTTALAGPLACRDRNSLVYGPCKSPDPVTFFPANASSPAVIVANFGLLEPGAGTTWQYACDDTFGQPEAIRERRSSNGTFFFPTTRGLMYTQNRCEFHQAGGDIAGKIIYDVAVDAKDPNLVFAIGDTPRVLWKSTDAGLTFKTIQTFPAGLALLNVVLPPGRTREIYLVGRGKGTATPVAASTDDGATFTMRDPGLAAGAAITTSFEFLAADPASPQTLYFTLLEPDGDRLWRSTDAGVTVAPLLKLGKTEGLSGLAFGPSPGTLYLAATDLFPLAGNPPGDLYVSRDGGKSWLPPRPSPETGPQFACLVAAGARLYACSTGQGRKDDLMLGYSDDEGMTWKAMTTLGSLAGPKACVKQQCEAVSQWLCDTYTSCAEGMSPTPNTTPEPPPDAGAPPPDANVPTPTLPKEDSGCAFATGSASGGAAAAALALLALLVGRRRKRPISW
jgi:MYXO-CTERM domain-containing protein